MQPAIHWTALDPAKGPDLHIGDRVSFDAGCAPILTVVRLEPGCAWVSDEHGLAMRPLSAIRWKAEEA